MPRVPRPADDAERQRDATWIASRGSVPELSEGAGGNAAAAEATVRRAAGRAKEKEAGANADTIDI